MRSARHHYRLTETRLCKSTAKHYTPNNCINIDTSALAQLNHPDSSECQCNSYTTFNARVRRNNGALADLQGFFPLLQEEIPNAKMIQLDPYKSFERWLGCWTQYRERDCIPL